MSYADVCDLSRVRQCRTLAYAGPWSGMSAVACRPHDALCAGAPLCDSIGTHAGRLWDSVGMHENKQTYTGTHKHKQATAGTNKVPQEVSGDPKCRGCLNSELEGVSDLELSLSSELKGSLNSELGRGV